MDVRGLGTRAWSRLRAGSYGSLQCGLAAALAWAFSVHVLGHPKPFFASVAAVVALGVRPGQRRRRTAELAFGVALGVLVGDLVVGLIGSGTWQIAVVVAAGLLIAVACGGTGLVVTQSGLQAVFVVALPRTPNSGLHRWEDALVGGAVALVIAALLSTDPWRDARRLSAAYMADLAAVLREVAAGLRAQSPAAVGVALERARALEPSLTLWQEALASGRETTRLSLLRDDRDDFWGRGLALSRGLTRGTRNLRVLIRRCWAALDSGQSLPTSLPGLLEELADAVQSEPAEACARLLELAGKLDPVVLGATSLSGQVVVGQLRVAAVDLLEGLGLERDRARNALPALAA
ncbi:MAG: FUSC family protein [Mycobacteriales bacterium]